MPSEKFPGYPTWLRDVQEESNGNPRAFPEYLCLALEDFRKANRGEVEAALKIAISFEHGTYQEGMSIDQAIRWYGFAADLGSGEAALRAARLLIWRKPDEKRFMMDMAIKAIHNSAIPLKTHGQEDAHIVLLAALLLLDCGNVLTDDDFMVLDRLFLMEDFARHPDANELKNKISLARSLAGHDV
jgi:hypothetical protein